MKAQLRLFQGVAAMALVWAAPASGQEAGNAPAAEDPGTTDIVVTALKRDTTLTETPATVNVLTADNLTSAGITNISQIASHVPSLVFQQTPNSTYVTAIRGIGSGPAVQSFDQSVALFFDGIFSPRGRDFGTSMFDIADIQVVKGAQTAILGKNTSAGGVVVTTRRPGFDFGFNATASYEFELDSQIVEGGFDLPLSPTLAVRAYGRYADQGGWIRNDLTGEEGTETLRVDGRISLLWEPSDDFSLFTYYQRDYNRSRNSNFQLVSDNLGIARYFANLAGVTNFETDLDRHVQMSNPAFDNRSYYDAYIFNRAFLEARWNIGGGTLTSTTGFAENHPRGSFGDNDGNVVDQDALPGDYYTVHLFEKSRQFSEELRYSSDPGKPFSFFVGLLGYHNRYAIDFYLLSNFPAFPGPPAIPARRGATLDSFVQETDAVSAFGQATLEMTDSFKLLVAGRYTYERKKATDGRTAFAYSDNGLTIPTPPTPVFALQNVVYAARDYRRSERAFDPTLTLQYSPSRNLNFYVSAGQGTKSGGFQNNTNTPDSNEYPAERARTIEGGAKFSGSFGHLYLSAFHTSVKNFQLAYFDGASFLLDRQRVKVDGVEFDGLLNVVPGLSLSANVAYTDAMGSGAIIAANNGRAFRAPKWSGNVEADYSTPLTGSWNLNLNGGVEFRSSMRLNSNTAIPLSRSYGKINARVGVEDSDSGLSISLIGRNLNNKLIANFGVPGPAGPGTGEVGTDMPRTIMLQFSIKR